GRADVIESATDDADGDCITDQFDAQDTVHNDDLSPMLDIVCSTQGICADQRAHFGVTCASGTAACVYDDVPGFADPETTCDGLDENCSGAADENFADRDADHVADCVDSDWDNDGVGDASDVCPTVSDAAQGDADADGIGDVCASRYRLVFDEAPSHVVLGTAFGAVVRLAAPDDEVAVGAPLPVFHGVVALAMADGVHTIRGASGAPSATAVAGVATFSDLRLDAPGSALVIVATSGVIGEARSEPFDAEAGEVASFRVEGAPASVVAGAPFGFAVGALDTEGAVVTSYRGTVGFAASDASATLPGARTFTEADEGSAAVGGAVLRTAGVQTVRVV
ncbi:MAG: thrombospondin type 3 repeat-containing protein, partial [Deltaproteobacteria bacterium]|nr:thrombospondin type 3 repeat-containing protein [Deltaproteobacteria bacterium]